MAKKINIGSLLSISLGEVVSEWMLQMSIQLKDQIDLIDIDEYDSYGEYIEAMNQITDFSDQILFSRRERIMSLNLDILFHDLQELMNEFGMLDELDDLENRLFSKISQVLKDLNIEMVTEPPTSFRVGVQQITNCYLERLYSGLAERFSGLEIYI